MKKIAYVSSHPLDSETGVAKKIQDQIIQWKKFGYEVMVFSFSEKIAVPRHEERSIVHYRSESVFRKRCAVAPLLTKDLENFCPDIVYYRHDLFSANYKYIAEKYPTVVEVQTDELSETFSLARQHCSVKYYLAYLISLCTRDMVFKKSRGIVAVTNELSCSRRFTKYGKPIVAIPNGILLTDHRSIKKGSEGRIQLFFMGSAGYSWHGTDFIEKLARFLPDLDFHIVGLEGSGQANVFYHGYMKAAQYHEIMQKCHVCIGTLALFRKKMKEASPLKVREYLAKGFPVILGYEDTSFMDGNRDFLLHVDFVRESVATIAQKIHEFCKQNKTRIVSHAEICQIDSELLESRRIAFLKSIFE